MVPTTLKGKLLSITSEFPWPLNSGGHLRTYHLQNELGRVFDAELVFPGLGNDACLAPGASFQTTKFEVANRNVASESYRAFSAMVVRRPYSMFYRHYRRPLEKFWNHRIASAKPDIVWLDHIDSFLYFPLNVPTQTRVFIDLHNIYSLILDRLASECANPLRKFALGLEARRMTRVERDLCRKVDAVVAVSSQEADYYKSMGAKKVHVAPNGVDCDSVLWSERKPNAAPRILFVGAMNWQPNVSAAISLATGIFPRIRARFPDAELSLVGRDPIASVKDLGKLPGVTVTGTVPSIAPYLEDANVFAVPLDSGGGTRLKILEAFAAGVPVVSTAIGAEGIDLVDGVHARLADRNGMAETIIALIEGDQGKQLAKNARQLVEERYDWKAIGSGVGRFLNEDL